MNRPVRKGVSSLVDLALYRHISRRTGRIPQDESPAPPPRLRDSFLDTISTDHPYYDELIDDPVRLGLRMSSSQGDAPQHTVKIYLSTASLVIVPRILLKQWEGQVLEHCGRAALRSITVGKELPTLREVMNADVSSNFQVVCETRILTKSVARVGRADHRR